MELTEKNISDWFYNKLNNIEVAEVSDQDLAEQVHLRFIYIDDYFADHVQNGNYCDKLNEMFIKDFNVDTDEHDLYDLIGEYYSEWESESHSEIYRKTDEVIEAWGFDPYSLPYDNKFANMSDREFFDYYSNWATQVK